MFSVSPSKFTEDSRYMMCYAFDYGIIQPKKNVKDAFVMQTCGRGHAPIEGKGALFMETSDQVQTCIKGTL